MVIPAKIPAIPQVLVFKYQPGEDELLDQTINNQRKG